MDRVWYCAVTAAVLSSRALLGDEKSQVEQVYSVDGEIDQQEREIENICMRLLLLQRPFASDLRKISAALKMISDLERIGDQAADIAELSAILERAGGEEHA